MKIKWIGQAGLLIEADGKIILVDPYLSNSVEEVRFAKRIGAKCAVPIHWRMFDEINPAIFEFDGAIIPKIYEYVNIS